MLERPVQIQEKWYHHLLKKGRNTEWGRKHHLSEVEKQEDFSSAIPVQDYESLKPYIRKMLEGQPDVLWPGKTKWFAKSSGTTSDKSKFIPVSQDNLHKCHIRGSWDTTTLIYHNLSDANQFANKSMIMGGSFANLPEYPQAQIGDVSAILLKQMPFYVRPFFLPDVETALIPDWDKKLEKLARAAIRDPRVVMIGGVPTWTVVLFRRILELTGKENMLEVWPDFQVYVHGGVSFTPYRKQFEEFFPSERVFYQEIYNASEGYFGVQDCFSKEGMLLMIDNGIYYEFIPMEQWDVPNPKTIPLSEVEKDRHYAMVITTNSGLWRYMPGDTVRFTSIRPYRLTVTGRTKQFVNAFGEEVIVDNTDQALALTCKELDTIVSEYTVAPVFFSGKKKGGHQWLVEFEKPPSDQERFAHLLDSHLQGINSDYEAKRYGNLALEPLHLQAIPAGTFRNWLAKKGKAGGQHKVPRLANHRHYVEDILQFLGEEVR